VVEIDHEAHPSHSPPKAQGSDVVDNGEPASHQISKLAKQILAAKERDKDSDTSVMETEIDGLLYRLYDVTEEEIAIVEGSTANRESTAPPAVRVTSHK
jgi:hypothetical protein